MGMGARVRVRLGAPHELDSDPFGAPQVERTGVLPLFLARDHDPGAAHPALESGPLTDPERQMIHARSVLLFAGIP